MIIWKDMEFMIGSLTYKGRITNIGRHVVIDILDVDKDKAKEAVEMIVANGLSIWLGKKGS